MQKVIVIGAGLAGCEAALRLADQGLCVDLYDMKPLRHSPAHKMDSFAELVCSNSLKADRISTAAGLLKAEMRKFSSVCLDAAKECSVPAGGALAVDRNLFSEYITKRIQSHPKISVIHEIVSDIPKDSVCIVATGPLTDGSLADSISRICGTDSLSFFDAAAPIVTKESIDFNIAFFGNRYEQEKKKDETIEQWKKRLEVQYASYINLPMDKDEYEKFVEELIKAEVVTLHEFEKREIFEGCMPIEIMAKRGLDT